MKYIILILTIILLTSCKTRSNSDQSELYKVLKIDSINSYYIVYCEKDAEKYKIVSKEQNANISNYGSKIKIGESYNLTLDYYHPNNNDKNPLTNTSTTPYVIRCYMFTDTEICQEQGINGLYIAKNLKGLYYVK